MKVDGETQAQATLRGHGAGGGKKTFDHVFKLLWWWMGCLQHPLQARALREAEVLLPAMPFCTLPCVKNDKGPCYAEEIVLRSVEGGDVVLAAGKGEERHDQEQRR